jgi:hypothetical protein
MKVNKTFRFSPKFFDETETSILFRFFGNFGPKFFSLETLIETPAPNTSKTLLCRYSLIKIIIIMFLTVFSMASRSPGNKNNLIYIKFRRFNNGLLPSSGKSWKIFSFLENYNI